MLHMMAQICIPLLGTIAMILLARKNKWGFVIGLVNQPFWFYETYTNKQWGILAQSIIICGVWMYGAYKWFSVKKEKEVAHAGAQKSGT